MKQSPRVVGALAFLWLMLAAGSALADAPITTTSFKSACATAQAEMTGAAANDPMQREHYAQALAENGKYAAALKEYLWCLDEGNQHDPSFSAVRLSFLLGNIKNLGKQYPPAIDALKTRRDKARAALEQGTGGADAAEDFSAYNDNLMERWRTLEEYDRLKGAHPALAGFLMTQIADILVEKRRYSELASDTGRAASQVDRAIEIYQDTRARGGIGAGTISYMKQKTVETCGFYFEALVGAGKHAAADTVRDKLLAVDHEPAAYEALIQHAARAGKPKAVKQLLALAQQKLSAQDFQAVQKAAGQ